MLPNAIICVCVRVLCQWRSAAKKKQEEDDFSFARELRDREKRLQALEEQLEQRARSDQVFNITAKDLEGFYSM